jgi:hypothetical protein
VDTKEKAAEGKAWRGPRFPKQLLKGLPGLEFGHQSIGGVLDVKTDLGTLLDLDAEMVIGPLEALAQGRRKPS